MTENPIASISAVIEQYFGSFNPLSPKSDQDQISPCNVSAS